MGSLNRIFLPSPLRVWLAVVLVLAAMAALGCAAAAPEPTSGPEPAASAVEAVKEPPSPGPASSGAPTGSRPGNPMAGEEDINPILATTILNPGEQRVSFLLVGKKAIIKASEASVAAIYQGEGGGSAQETTAVFHGWPFGIRGAYSARINFDRPGLWQLKIAVDDGEVSGETTIDLEVVEQSPVPAIGQRPPLSRTKTLADVPGVEQLTTDYNADEDLYQLTVAQAIESPRPAVVVFASPAFCTSATCGPQVDTVKELKAAFVDQRRFRPRRNLRPARRNPGRSFQGQFRPRSAGMGLLLRPPLVQRVLGLHPRRGRPGRPPGSGAYVTLTELEAALKGTLEAG